MASEQAIQTRDRLNAIIDELTQKKDQESYVLACCIAVAVEEMEKWMYHGEFTQSVAPYREGKEWNGVPVKPEEADDEKFVGPPWARKKKEIFDDLPTLRRIKQSGKPIKTSDISDLGRQMDKYDPGDWDTETRDAFTQGNILVFVARIQRHLMPNIRIPAPEALSYARRMQKQWPHLWACKKSPAQNNPMT